MSTRLGDDSIYTDSNDDAASRDRHAIKSGYSIQDKVTAYSSIALGVIGFTIFFCYYCTPLIKARRSAKAAKRRQELLKPFSYSQRKLYGLDDSFSNYSSDSNEFEPATPRRIVSRDSIGLTKARQAAVPLDLNPFLSHFPSPPQSGSVAVYERRQSPFFNVNGPYNNLSTSPSPKAPYTTSNALSFASLPQMGSFSPTFVISDSQDSVSDTKAKLSSSSSSLRQFQRNLTVHPVSSSASLSANLVCGMPPPRSSSLNALLSSSTLSASTGLRNQTIEHETCRKTSSIMQVPSQRSPPVYADEILPRYLRESSVAPSLSRIPSHAESREGKALEYSRTPTRAAAGSANSNPGPEIHSLHVQDSVLARATSYTRGLVGASPPQLRGQVGTELQFEMVKKRESIMFW